MKATYDPDTDVMYLQLRAARIVESDEVEPGIIVDYDSRGGIVAVEILDATKRSGRPLRSVPDPKSTVARARPAALAASRSAAS